MYLDSKNHTSTLIGSLKKAFKAARRKGTYSVRDLYFLHCIYRTIKYACEIGTTEIMQKELVAFYFKILSSSNNFCTYEFESAYYKSAHPNELYVQTKDNTSYNAPTVSDFTLTGEAVLTDPIIIDENPDPDPGPFTNAVNLFFEYTGDSNFKLTRNAETYTGETRYYYYYSEDGIAWTYAGFRWQTVNPQVFNLPSPSRYVRFVDEITGTISQVAEVPVAVPIIEPEFVWIGIDSYLNTVFAFSQTGGSSLRFDQFELQGSGTLSEIVYSGSVWNDTLNYENTQGHNYFKLKVRLASTGEYSYSSWFEVPAPAPVNGIFTSQFSQQFN